MYSALWAIYSPSGAMYSVRRQCSLHSGLCTMQEGQYSDQDVECTVYGGAMCSA